MAGKPPERAGDLYRIKNSGIQKGYSHSKVFGRVPARGKTIRLTNLIPEILDMVDDGRIAFRPAVELSYLTEQEQSALYDTMGREDCTPSLAQAIKMKAFSRDGKLTNAVILSIMEEEKPNQKEQFRIPKERISKYFKPGTPARTMPHNTGVAL